jgi:micrococcal nuclease|tara:strand:+ start:1094 stop:1585 length:492 start_codon:yes stop_codon:yes gene_type:complete
VKSPSTNNCYNFRVISIDKIVDGDTIDVTFDLGFDICKSERIRVAGIDSPEKRTRNLEEKELGIEASEWLECQLEGAIAGKEDLVIKTELEGGKGKFGRLLGWLYIGYPECENDCKCNCHHQSSINETMVEKGYAWEYDGGTKSKDLESLREVRRSQGTLISE